jgi:hypothetical protein
LKTTVDHTMNIASANQPGCVLPVGVGGGNRGWTLPPQPQPRLPSMYSVTVPANLAVAYGSFQQPNPTIQQKPMQRHTDINYNSVVKMPTASPSSQSSHSYSTTIGNEQLSKTNLYIRGLKPEMNDKDLVNMCQQYGKIISTKAIIDQATGKCKGYGFVDYDNEAAAESAVQALQRSGIQAQMAKQQEQDTTNLYIANLPSQISEPDLERYFGNYGTVISTRILRDNGGNSRGVGFARMETKEHCEAIIQAFNGTCLQGTKDQQPLTVKFADGGNKKKLQYQNKQWMMDGQPEGIAIHHPYEHLTIASNGLAQSLPFAGIPRYAMTTSPMGNYHLPPGASWLAQYPPGPYLVQTPLTMMPSNIHQSGPQVDPSMLPQLSAQMGQLQIASQPQFMTGPGGTTYMHMAYPPAHMQTIAIEEAAPGDESLHHHGIQMHMMTK